MKIVLFRDGKPGVAARLPGENPEAELADLLGGETEMVPLNERLTVVMLKDGEAMERPARYRVHRLGRAPLDVYGDCAVVGVRLDGGLRDVGTYEVVMAEARVQPSPQGEGFGTGGHVGPPLRIKMGDQCKLGTPEKPHSGFVGERRSSEADETCRLRRRGEGCGACDDVGR